MDFQEWKKICHEYAQGNGFWEEYYKKSQEERQIFALKLLLIITEAAEVVEELRQNVINKQNVGEEVGDIFIRLFDLVVPLEKTYGIDIEKLMEEKHKKNQGRPRLHGKAF